MNSRSFSQQLTAVIIVAALVAVGAWAFRLSTARRARAEQQRERETIATAAVRRGDFEAFAEGIGRLEAVKSQTVVAGVSGQILTLVPNGVVVKTGDVIAVLDVPRMARQVRDQAVQFQQASDDLEARKRTLAAAVEQARIGLQQAEQELARFRSQQDAELLEKRTQRDHDAAELDLARERASRKQRLAQEGLLPQRDVELDAADLKAREFGLERETKELEVAEARRSSDELDKEAAGNKAKSDLARAQSAQQDETRNAEMTLKIRQQQLIRVQDQLAKAAILAPIAGIVVLEQEREGMSQRPLEPGDRAWEGRSIATIPDLTRMRAVLSVPQEQARQIKRRQRVIVRVEALPGQELEGEVTEIAQTASEGNIPGTGMATGEKVFRTVVDIKDTRGAPLRPGMTANVRIIVEKVPNAVRVPRVCVFDREERQVVYVKRGSRFEEVRVKLGLQNDDEAVVVSGLKGGEVVALRDLGESGEAASGGQDAAPSTLPL
jgi:RND family efflux transporter MFP subunit